MSISAIVTRGFLFSPSLIVTDGFFGAEVVAQAITAPAPAGRPVRRRVRRKKREYDNWNAMIWPREQGPQAPPPAPPAVFEPTPGNVTDGSEPAAPHSPRPVAINPALVKAMAGKVPDLQIVDPAIRRKAAELRAKLRRELEDEEILLMLGAFD